MLQLMSAHLYLAVIIGVQIVKSDLCVFVLGFTGSDLRLKDRMDCR